MSELIYCLKCKKKVSVTKTKLVEKDGRCRKTGKCPVCDSKVSVFVACKTCN